MGENMIRKIIREHLAGGEMAPGREIGLRIDQVLIQDTTGTMVYLQFEAMGLDRVRCDLVASYADHQTYQFDFKNTDDHRFIQSAAHKYGAFFSRPGNGICHVVHNERFAKPGQTLLGADSHTQHQGGVGMLAIGAGGLDCVVAMGGGPYWVQMPKVVRVTLKGKLNPWVTAKEVNLELLRRLTVSGGKGKAFEFVGPAIKDLSVPERNTITNFCTELGATSSAFPSDEVTRDYLRRLGREEDWIELGPDEDADYDDELEIDLSELEPLVAAPSMPDNIVPVTELVGTPVHQVIVGSCTNGSYTDIAAVHQVLKGRRVHPNVCFVVAPGSKQAAELIARDGRVADFLAAGVNWSEATCGPCIGIGHVPSSASNSVRTINRNFKGRSGLENDNVFLTSPALAAVVGIYGEFVDPRQTDLTAPDVLVAERYDGSDADIIPPAPADEADKVELVKGPNIGTAPSGKRMSETVSGEVLLVVGDDISTDHIMPARSDILQYRSNIPKLAEYTMARIDETFAARAREKGGGWVVGGDNYGQGSSREHAAICPMFLGVKGVLARSFARIHKSNLINFGVLPLEFVNLDDYDGIEQGDELELRDARTQVEQEDELVIRNVSKGEDIRVRLEATERERRMLLHGGLLAYTREKGAENSGSSD